MKRYLFFISQPYSFAILRPIQHVIRQRGDDVAWYFDGSGGQYLRSDEYRLHKIEDVKKYNPRAVFVPGNRVFDFFPGVKVQVFHGFSVHKRSESRGHFRIRGFFDLYCTQGPATTQPFMKLAQRYKYFKVVETGWPKMDPLFSNPLKSKSNERPVILYTSTFTPKLSSAETLFETIQKLSASERWRWIVTFHPRMDPQITERYKSIAHDHLTFVETDDVIPLLLEADVMVSDTSSIMAEFLLLQKPVVTFRTTRPGPHLIDISQPDKLQPAIEHALTRPPQLMSAIQQYTSQIHPYRDGLSSVRVVDATEHFIEHEYPCLSRKPLNIFRRIKMRLRVGYYHWN